MLPKTIRFAKASLPAAMVALGLLLQPLCLRAEVPGEFRPKPCPNPTEKVGGTGVKIQPPDTLPKSRAPLGTAQRKPKLARKGQPQLRGGNELVLNAGWELAEAPKLKQDGAALSQPGVDTRDWYDATVPGTVLTTLVEQGVYPDPLYGLNNLAVPESLNKQDYWYRTEFAMPASFAGRELWLQFKGINYYAEVWLNGQYLGHITGAFIRGEFNVTKLAQPGRNVLAVMVAPPPDPGIPSEESVAFGDGDNGGALCLDGPTFVCTEGWDWIPGIRDRCTGLWQDVIVRATGPVTLSDPQVVTALPLPDTSRADVTVQVQARNATTAPQQGLVRGHFEGVTFEQPVTLNPGETKTISFAPKEYSQLTVKHPRLWWPNGYGKPELYHLDLGFVASDKKESDHLSRRFGIRELSYEFAASPAEGKGEPHRYEFTPTVGRETGERVIDNRRASMHWPDHATDSEKETQVALWPGAEHSPALKPVKDDAMGRYLVVKVNGQKILCLGGNWGMDDAMKRVTRERLEPCMRLERDANLNMVRNWAGQSTSEVFYELCDEYGLLVWNDFWLNTEGWNYNPVDEDLFLRNVEDTVKRFRTHPSIALWCARNEGVPTEPVNQGIDRIVREDDGTRYYQPSSRLINLRDSGLWWNLPLDKFFHQFNQGFSTEMGASCIPSAEFVRTIMPEADLWPTGDVWAYHDLHSKGAASLKSILERINPQYGAPKDMEDLCRKAQMLNYETHRAIYEGFNSRMWHSCSGVLNWMSHPCWPSVVWEFYTCDYEPSAVYFGARKAAEPVHIQMTLPECTVQLVNHTAATLDGANVSASLYDLTGCRVQNRQATLTGPADTTRDVFQLDWPGHGAYFAKLELRDKHGHLLSENFYWHARDEKDLQQLNTLPAVALKGKIHSRTRAGKEAVEGEITNPSNAPALQVKLTLRDASTGKRLLPAYYSDNYICLLPGETRKFTIETGTHGVKTQVDLDGWNIAHGSLK